MVYVPQDSFLLRYAVDFTRLPTQNLAPDGTYTLDGKSWTSEFTAAANSVQQTSGTGIVFDVKPGATSVRYGDDVRAAPMIRCDLTSLIGNVELARIRGLRVRARIQLTNVNEAAEFAKVGLEWATTPARFHLLPGRGWPPTPAFIGVQDQIAVAAGPSRDLTIETSDDIIESVWQCGDWAHDVRRATYNSGFPKPSKFQTSSTAGIGANVIANATTGHLRVVLEAQPTGSASSFTATFTHLEIHELVH